MYLVAYKSVRTLLLELTTQTESALRKKVIKTLHRRLVRTCVKLTNLQILGCELHQNAFGGRGPLGELECSPSRY